MMNRRQFLLQAIEGATGLALCRALHAADTALGSSLPRPNIIYILCDDLGSGDVRCLNPRRGKIATPNIDRLASQGMTFTDAHSGSAVCTPTRYGILTGRYSWRTRLQSGVLLGGDAPLIAPGRLTVPALLKQRGYTTVALGKWHLGMDMPALPRTGSRTDGQTSPLWDIDFRGRILGGPTAVGFDSFYGISASLDMPPYVYIENDRFTAVPTVEKKWTRQGPAAADFEAVDVLPALTRKAVQCVERQGADAKRGKPFFLYLALTSPHTPIVPTEPWKGKSGLGGYGDFVMETDDAVGQVLKALDVAGLSSETLVIFTSDNGCSPEAGVEKLEAQGHFPSADLRGYKSDIWDGGHRIPFIVRWPGRVRPGSRSAQTICLTDLLATYADMAGTRLPDTAGEDSVSILPALLGKDRAPLREAVVHHSINGKFAIRQGRWKLELCPGSGGWSKPGDPAAAGQGLPEVQLYDMSGDIAETKNVQSSHPDVVRRLTTLLEKYVADGRSTPGQAQKNDAAIDILKKPKAGT
jgi:arylsulfatase A